MSGPWPADVQAAIRGYYAALERWRTAQEAIPYSEVELALLMVGTATVAWAERVGRAPAPPGRRVSAAVPVRRMCAA